MMIHLGADHRGFELKERIKKSLMDEGYEVSDAGAVLKDQNDDYTDFATAVAEKVGRNEQSSRGILICGSGAGMVVMANKFRRVRAAIGFSNDQVFDARHDDDVNILVLAASFTEYEPALAMVKVFLQTPFSNEDRYQRRLDKIARMEDA
ncbi:MAG TPA: RpiB/LacA/LacB family sugar-phosphate isomerase [Candidatus Paceibacterota bacterium]